GSHSGGPSISPGSCTVGAAGRRSYRQAFWWWPACSCRRTLREAWRRATGSGQAWTPCGVISRRACLDRCSPSGTGRSCSTGTASDWRQECGCWAKLESNRLSDCATNSPLRVLRFLPPPLAATRGKMACSRSRSGDHSASTRFACPRYNEQADRQSAASGSPGKGENGARCVGRSRRCRPTGPRTGRSGSTTSSTDFGSRPTIETGFVVFGSWSWFHHASKWRSGRLRQSPVDPHDCWSLVFGNDMELITLRQAVFPAEQSFGVIEGEDDDHDIGPVCRPGPAHDRAVGESVVVEESLGVRGGDEARRTGQREPQRPRCLFHGIVGGHVSGRDPERAQRGVTEDGRWNQPDPPLEAPGPPDSGENHREQGRGRYANRPPGDGVPSRIRPKATLV